MRVYRSKFLPDRRRANLFAALSVYIAVVAMSVCSGCGDGSRFEIAPVSGAVTLNGKPLTEARIGFEPMATGDSMAAGSGSYATTDEQGNFQLSTVHGKTGAVIGRHRVWIRTIKLDANGKMISKEILPREYNDDTTLTFEVPADGTDQANFTIAAKPVL
jgi:hypothetical protein